MRKSIPAVLAGVMIIGGLLIPGAGASHEPANKFAAAGSDIDQVDDATPILSEQMKISGPFDLVLSASAECSILTRIVTNNDTLSSTAYGSVRLWITIDGKRVPVGTDDTLVDNDDDNTDVDENGDEVADESDIGEVTFCNRAYSRTVEDQEDNTPPDGVDEEDDFIRTRTANAFNWVATDVGFDYDADGDNIVNIQLWADFDESVVGEGAADAFVGTRTLIAEPTSLSVHETVSNDGGAGN